MSTTLSGGPVTEDQPVRVVTEQRESGGWEAGTETPHDWYSRVGVYGETREAALARLVAFVQADVASGAESLARNMGHLAAAVQALLDAGGLDLGNAPSTVYELAGEFGGGRLHDVQAKLDAVRQPLWDLDRCEHGRHEGDICGGTMPDGCGGPSHGNPLADTTVGYGLTGRPITVRDLHALVRL